MSEASTMEPGATAGNGERPAIFVDDLHKSFGPVEVLKGVSLAARQGDEKQCQQA